MIASLLIPHSIGEKARAQFEEQKQNLQHQKKALIKFASGPRQARVTEDSIEIAGFLSFSVAASE